MKLISRAFAAAFIVSLVLTQSASADPLIFEYRGWKIDLSKARGKAPDAEMINTVKHQLDIVERVNLKPPVLQFMKTIKVWANPDLNPKLGPGHYGRATGVDIRVDHMAKDKPIVLHELLHAYHDQVVPEGFNNPDINTYFERGKGEWPADSYMMSNRREFFAVTASVYLFGQIERPPHTRQQIKAKQPRYYQWLADLFDGGKPR